MGTNRMNYIIILYISYIQDRKIVWLMFPQGVEWVEWVEWD